MATYYMNADVSKYTIIPNHSHPSEYQDLIDAYLAKGGKITKCREGARTTFDKIPSYDITPEEAEASKLKKGTSLFDQIELNKGKEYNETAEDLFDKRGRF
jgi:hypothetical protein